MTKIRKSRRYRYLKKSALRGTPPGGVFVTCFCLFSMPAGHAIAFEGMYPPPHMTCMYHAIAFEGMYPPPHMTCMYHAIAFEGMYPPLI